MKQVCSAMHKLSELETYAECAVANVAECKAVVETPDELCLRNVAKHGVAKAISEKPSI